MRKREIEQKIIDNEKLVYLVVNRHFPDLRGDDDIIQCGRIGLWKACEHYDSDKGKFSTLAVKCIYNAIMCELRSRSREYKKACITSLDHVIYRDKETGSEVTVGQSIPIDEAGYCEADYDLSFLARRLPRRDVEVFNMYLLGFSVADIAQAFGFSRTWAAKLVKKAQYIAKEELFK